MNRFAATFLILFFVSLIGIGALALREDVLLRGQANNLCPVPEFPENPACPDGLQMDLAKDKNDCYVFKCLPKSANSN